MIFNRLYDIVNANLSIKGNEKPFITSNIHSTLIRNEEVREILEIETPILENISDILELKKGNVFAIRLDKSYGITGFKKPVIASLILKRLIEASKRKEYNKKWIDGGNVNSSLALAYFAKKFEGEATYIMSRFFPEYIINYIKEISENGIEIIQAPNLKLGVERDFYQFLLNLVRTDEKFKNYQPLWHAKYSGEYSKFLGEDIIECLDFIPDYIVLVVGAGSTLEGQAIPIKLNFESRPKIVVPEHYESSLLKKIRPNIENINEISTNEKLNSNWFSSPPQGLPHSVIGPHYDEINPLLKPSVINLIDCVYMYDELNWKEMSIKCYENGLEIGNSSAANLYVSKQLAEKGYKVLTFIYEPFREFYHGHNIQNANLKKT